MSALMCAYNEVNGTSSCHNAALIGDEGYLRTEGFQGIVMRYNIAGPPLLSGRVQDLL